MLQIKKYIRIGVIVVKDSENPVYLFGILENRIIEKEQIQLFWKGLDFSLRFFLNGIRGFVDIHNKQEGV